MILRLCDRLMNRIGWLSYVLGIVRAPLVLIKDYILMMKYVIRNI